MDSFVVFILDSILALFLLAVLVMCIIVYRRLSVIKNGQEELGKLIESLNQAVSKAQKSVNTIKSAAIQADSELEVTIRKARSMVDELSLMTEVGNNLANRLEASSSAAPKGVAPVFPKEDIKAQTKEKQDILAALKEAR